MGGAVHESAELCTLAEALTGVTEPGWTSSAAESTRTKNRTKETCRPPNLLMSKDRAYTKPYCLMTMGTSLVALLDPSDACTRRRNAPGPISLRGIRTVTFPADPGGNFCPNRR